MAHLYFLGTLYSCILTDEVTFVLSIEYNQAYGRLKDHTYQKIDNNNNFLTIDQQYADDIGWASTGQHIIENIEKKVPHALKKRNLKINPEKTEKYRITRNGDTEWKNANMLEVS